MDTVILTTNLLAIFMIGPALLYGNPGGVGLGLFALIFTANGYSAIITIARIVKRRRYRRILRGR